MRKFMQSFLKDESGQSLTEYALIISVVSLGVIISLVAFRTQLGHLYTGIVSTIQSNS